MADQKQVEILLRNVEEWNAWRQEKAIFRPCLDHADPGSSGHLNDRPARDSVQDPAMESGSFQDAIFDDEDV